MTNVEFYIDTIKLEQLNSFQPTLQVSINLKHIEQDEEKPQYMKLIGLQGKLLVRNHQGNWIVLCIINQDNNDIIYKNQEVLIRLSGFLSPYLMLKLEELRIGDDLIFKIQILTGLTIPQSNNTIGIGTIHANATRSGEWKYAQSEWVKDLNATEFNKIELIELPKIEFPNLSLTKNIVKFIDKAKQADLEGRYGEVLTECRRALDALTLGLKEWRKDKSESINDEKQKPTLLILLGNNEKADRLQKVINGLHSYMSLDPHEPEYHGIVFTNYDAKFILITTTGLINSILRHIEKN